MEQKRVTWLDDTRGICVFCVLLAHSGIAHPYIYTLYSGLEKSNKTSLTLEDIVYLIASLIMQAASSVLKQTGSSS